jgi:hypothetical protein
MPSVISKREAGLSTFLCLVGPDPKLNVTTRPLTPSILAFANNYLSPVNIPKRLGIPVVIAQRRLEPGIWCLTHLVSVRQLDDFHYTFARCTHQQLK